MIVILAGYQSFQIGFTVTVTLALPRLAASTTEYNLVPSQHCQKDAQATRKNTRTLDHCISPPGAAAFVRADCHFRPPACPMPALQATSCTLPRAFIPSFRPAGLRGRTTCDLVNISSSRLDKLPSCHGIRARRLPSTVRVNFGSCFCSLIDHT